jgi:hypothetical protein
MRHPNEVKPGKHLVLEIYIFWTDRTMERHRRIHNIYSQPQISIVERHIASYQCCRRRSARNQSMRHLSHWPNLDNLLSHYCFFLCLFRKWRLWQNVTALIFSPFRAWFHPFGDFCFAQATGRLKNTSTVTLIWCYMLISSKNGSYAWFSPEIMQI